MNDYIAAVTWRGAAFLRNVDGETWRVWFSSVGEPRLERLTVGDGPNYREPLEELSNIVAALKRT